MSTTARPPNTDRDASGRSPAPARQSGHARTGNPCTCVCTDGTTTTRLRHLAPLRNGVEGIID
jgi:hypothetical protein